MSYRFERQQKVTFFHVLHSFLCPPGASLYDIKWTLDLLLARIISHIQTPRKYRGRFERDVSGLTAFVGVMNTRLNNHNLKF